MRVRQFRYSADNLGYLIYGKETSIAVDGGATESILCFLRDYGLKLDIVTNTHSHGDHTIGNSMLLRSTGARYLSSAELAGKGRITLEGEAIDVISTPGHSADSVCLLCGGILLSGDTLFNGKVGRCFTGDYSGFLDSISRLMELPGDTLVMGGHDYVKEYMDFARMIQPENPAIDSYLGRYDPEDISYTLAEEKEVDPFLRLDEGEVIAFLENRGLSSSTPLQRFTSLFKV